MNLNDGMLNIAKKGTGKFPFQNNFGIMGPPTHAPPRKASTSDSSALSASDINWGKRHISLVLNSSSNKKSTKSASSKSTSENEDQVLLAITEGRGQARCEIGMAAINTSKPHILLCQMSDSQSYINTLAKINIINPDQIIYPLTFESPKYNRLIEQIKKFFPKKKLIPFVRKAFNRDNGMDKLFKIALSSSFPLLIILKNRYYTVAAAGALLSYLQDRLYIYYTSNCIKLEYESSEGYAMIDISTADRLELVSSMQSAQANKYSTLLGVINHCLTKAGSRNLRSTVLQPFYSVEKIQERLKCVTQLISRPDLLLSIQGILPKFSNIEQLLTLSTLVPQDPQSCSNAQLNYLLVLNGILDTTVALKQVTKLLTPPFFEHLTDLLNSDEFDDMKTLIRKTICEDAYFAKGKEAETRRIWAIKSGVNGFFDLIRKTYSERVEDMRVYVKSLGEKHNLPLILSNNNKKGYHMVLPLNKNQKQFLKSSKLPDEFIQVTRMANSFTMKTPELVNLATRIDDILRDLFTISNLIVHKTVAQIKQYAHLFYKLVENVAYLDVLQSLAEASLANSWVKPEFNDYTEVVLGRHPMLDFLCKPVSNPITSCEHYSSHVITGPNGSGKSIYIRQVMLLQIMAQIGCYVPAQSAIFKSADRMFARISNEDDMECGASSFVLEMHEVNYILNIITENSLIIIDELCRSTSVEEGTAIAMSVCDKLINSKTYFYVTTHYGLLSKLADIFLNVKVWQMETISSEASSDSRSVTINYNYKLVPNATTVQSYGIYMVKDIWTEDSLRNVTNFQQQTTKSFLDPKFANIDKEVRLKHELLCKVAKLKLRKKLTVGNLNDLLAEYRDKLSTLGSSVVEDNLNLAANGSFQINHSIFDATLRHLSSDSIQPAEDILSQSNIIKFTSESQQDSFQPSNMTPINVEQPMQDVFTPCSNLDQSQSSVLSRLIPEINLSCSNTSASPDQAYPFSINNEMVNRELSFMDGFLGHLTSNPRLTSTPMPPGDITITTPKMSFTILNNTDGLDISAIQADLESFLEDEEANREMEHAEDAPIKENSRVEDTNEFNNDSYGIQKHVHLFPNVHVVEGPNDLSSDDPNSTTNAEEAFKLSFVEYSNNRREKTHHSEEIILDKSSTVLDRPVSSTSPELFPSQKESLDEECFDDGDNETEMKTISIRGNERNNTSTKTSISAASKLRRLDDTVTSSSELVEKSLSNKPEEELEQKEEEEAVTTVKVQEDKDSSKTSISEASKQRKLDDTITTKDELNENVSSNKSENEEIGKEVICVVNNQENNTSTKSSTAVASKLRGLDDTVTSKSDTVENNQEDKTCTKTSISAASKMRRLDEPTDNTAEYTVQLDENHCGKSGCSEKNELPEEMDEEVITTPNNPKDGASTKTSVSAASKLRRLDVTVDTTTDSKLEENGDSHEKSEQPKRRKVLSPSKLSRKQIQQEFLEQDRLLLFNSSSSSDLTKMWEQRLRRPTARQIQGSTCIATVRKTDYGVEVIPAPTQKKRKRLSNSVQPFTFKNNINMNIFSDANANTFEEFLKSDKKDYRQFNFKFGLNNQAAESPSNMFDFKQVNEVSCEYAPSSISLSFMRRHDSDVSLTPDGYCKNNRHDINNLLNKYR
ncbi:uncharacterized protein LOC115888541 [Sitophilus oryzae]|uniref:Uncharacterized protein LOC115888541 n=1 Tax=Sitophilus oryzae TaxID=7048 RepID=A0A6J2YMU7_SITOR|nr:uncharacterized protein LOC115888541 [Sitophilus oryzae]